MLHINIYVYLCRRNLKENKMKTIKEIAILICQYNGQKATEKQIQKCIKSFNGSIELMIQFCNNRIKL